MAKSIIIRVFVLIFSFYFATNNKVIGQIKKKNSNNLKKIMIDTLGLTEYHLEDSIICRSIWDTVTNREVFVISDKKPFFGKNPNDITDYIKANLKYPDFQMNIVGRVFVRFVVETDGTLSNLEILRGIAPSLDNEAINLIKNMPLWIPGECNGKKVPAYVTLPIDFSVYD